MYNLREYSSHYSEIKGNLRCFSKDEATNFEADMGNNSLKSFECKTKLLGKAEANGVNGF